MARHHLFSKALLVTCIATAGISSAPAIYAKSKDTTEISFQDLLQQERQWAGLKTQSKTVADITWTYSEGGSANKPTLLLVHGLAGTRDNWNRVAHYLTPYYHVIIPDLPYHGETTAPDDFDTSIPNMTEKLRRFAEALQVEKNLNIAGHSLGGAIVMLYAAQYSTDTKSMLLVDAAGVYKTANTVYLKDPNTLQDLMVTKPGDFNKLMKLAMTNPPFIPKEILAEQEKLMIVLAPKTQKVVDQLVMIQKAFTPESFKMAANIIDCPVQIIWGAEDKIINPEVSYELKSLLKNAETPIIYKGVGHMPILELDQVVAKDYLQFLQKVQLQKPATPALNKRGHDS